MIKTDENALICDLAETYQIYDYKRLPLTQVAVFSYGLREDSRIKLKMSGQNVPLTTQLLALAVDDLAFLAWTKTKNAEKNTKRPESIVQSLMDNNKTKKSVNVYRSGEDFDKQREEIINKIRKEDD